MNFQYFNFSAKGGSASGRQFSNLQRGQAALTAVIFFLVAATTIGIGFTSFAFEETATARKQLRAKQSYFLAEAGMEDAVYRIKKNKQISAQETMTIDANTVTTNISDISGGKEIIANGNFTNNVRRVKINLATDTTGIEFFYGAQVGEGGLEMGQNSRIEGAGGTVGNVYSNGSVTGANDAKITGDLTVATGIAEDVQARSTVCNQDNIVGETNPVIDHAQSFQPSDSKPLAKISLYIKKVGNPSSRDVFITADNSGSPAQTSLAQGTLSSSLVGTAYSWVDITFPTPANLTQGTTYWIVLDSNQDNNKHWIWCGDSNQGYGNGVGKYSQSWTANPWTSITGDLNFKTYLGSGVSSIDSVVVLGTARANAITNSNICGDAYYQTIDASSLNFLNSPTSQTCDIPLTPGTAFPSEPDPPLLAMPISDGNITDWKNDAGCGAQPAVSPCLYTGDYSLSTNASLGPTTITGNLLMTATNKTLTVTGTIYVQGDINIDNGSRIVCAASYGANSCLVLTDGWIHIKNNGIFQGSGSAGSYIMFLSTLPCDGTSVAPPCDDAHHNGAIDLHNGAAGAIFYTSEGMINLHNGVNVTEVTAYKLRLDNTAVITYEQGLVNAEFSSGPSGGWDITTWREVE